MEIMCEKLCRFPLDRTVCDFYIFEESICMLGKYDKKSSVQGEYKVPQVFNLKSRKQIGTIFFQFLGQYCVRNEYLMLSEPLEPLGAP